MIPFRGKKYREKQFMLKNGEILLEKFITTFDGKRNPIRNFSSEELKLATNNYDNSNVMTTGAWYKIYKGFLDNRQISVMKYIRDDDQRCEDSINNIVFTSQMCHKNILKLIGCCLDTRTPILVFESMVKCGTLTDHICSRRQLPHFESLTWKQRLKITMEIANAFAYLHVGFGRPIVFAQLSLSGVLLDEHYVPKLVDFSFAKCIPEGKTKIEGVRIEGTFGYIAPERISEGILHEKCDVYGFGVLLLEVLVGQDSLAFFRSTETNDEFGENNSEIEDKDWWSSFLIKTVKSNRLIELIDPIIVGDGLCPEIEQQVIIFAELSGKCLSYSAEDRPTMIEAAKQLRQLYLSA